MSLEVGMSKDLNLLQEWVDCVRRADDLIDTVAAIFGGQPESMFGDVIEQNLQAFTRLVAKQVGDEGGFLDWYRFENDMGEKGFEAGPNNAPHRKICNIEDLLWAIKVEGEHCGNCKHSGHVKTVRGLRLKCLRFGKFDTSKCVDWVRKVK